MDIEHAAFAGISKASNDAERDDFRSVAAGVLWPTPALGAVGVADWPQAIPRTAMGMTQYPRISLLTDLREPLIDDGPVWRKVMTDSRKDHVRVRLS